MLAESGALGNRGRAVCVVGPTAVGKTALAVALAQRVGAEIINADSRQVYRGMNLGAAKPTAAEQAAARHHLLDLLDPGESFGLGAFLIYAADALRDIRGRGQAVIVCGGTGQYVWGLVNGAGLPGAPPDWELRAKLEAEAARSGGDALHRRLAAIDPVRAAALDARNVRRVIRALEIAQVTGRRPSDLHQRSGPPPLEALILGLTMPRADLYRRIDVRVDRMMAEGFLDEARGLAAAGFRLGEGPLNSPGYRELGQYLDGDLTLDEAVRQTKLKTHRLARRQYTWFKPADERIRWLRADDPAVGEQAAAAALGFLAGRSPGAL